MGPFSWAISTRPSSVAAVSYPARRQLINEPNLFLRIVESMEREAEATITMAAPIPCSDIVVL